MTCSLSLEWRDNSGMRGGGVQSTLCASVNRRDTVAHPTRGVYGGPQSQTAELTPSDSVYEPVIRYIVDWLVYTCICSYNCHSGYVIIAG